MKLKNLVFAVLGLFTMTALFSCSKDSSNRSTRLTADDLPQGKAKIEFKTNRSFGGITHFVSNNLDLSHIVKAPLAGNKDQYTITAARHDGTMIGTVQFSVHVPQGANTANGELTGQFGGNGSVWGYMLISNGDALNGQPDSYGSDDGGSITITKLTNEVIEGEFTFTGVNNTANQSIEVIEGKFAGKF
jgi:hypothetical protein